ncbi:MAG TPA: MFS transporter [Azospirillum sp.]|nr:MFS transporter [Azospirillum sp.]
MAVVALRLSPQSRAALLLVVAAMTGAQTVGSLCMFALPAVAPSIAETIGTTPALIGYQASLLYLGAMAAAAMGGEAIAVAGPCRTTQLCLLGCSIGLAATASASVLGIAVASVAVGAAYGMMNPAASHLLAMVTSGANRNVVFSIKQTGVPLGGVLAGLMLPALATAFGWRAAVLAAAALTAALALLLQPLRAALDAERPARQPGRVSPFAGIALVWARPVIRCLVLTGLLLAAVQFTLTTFLVTLLVEDVGLSLLAAGLLLAVMQTTASVARIAWGWLADWRRDGNLVLTGLAAGSALSTAALMALGPQWSQAAILPLLVLVGASAAAWNGIFMAELARNAPPAPIGSVVGGGMVFTFAGALSGPALFAAVHALLGRYTLTCAILAALSAAAVVLLARARRLAAAPATS